MCSMGFTRLSPFQLVVNVEVLTRKVRIHGYQEFFHQVPCSGYLSRHLSFRQKWKVFPVLQVDAVFLSLAPTSRGLHRYVI